MRKKVAFALAVILALSSITACSKNEIVVEGNKAVVQEEDKKISEKNGLSDVFIGSSDKDDMKETDRVMRVGSSNITLSV